MKEIAEMILPDSQNILFVDDIPENTKSA